MEEKGFISKEVKAQVRAIALAAMERLGKDSPASLMASDPMLLRLFADDFLATFNCLDPLHASKSSNIGEDGLTVTLESGSVLALYGYSSGIHRWEVEVFSAGRLAWLGVSKKPSDNIERYLGGPASGFGVPGQPDSRGAMCSSSVARSNGSGYESVPFFIPGDKLCFSLNSDAGVLEYTVTALEKTFNLEFGGNLKGLTLYPAFSVYNGTTKYHVTFLE